MNILDDPGFMDGFVKQSAQFLATIPDKEQRCDHGRDLMDTLVCELTKHRCIQKMAKGGRVEWIARDVASGVLIEITKRTDQLLKLKKMPPAGNA